MSVPGSRATTAAERSDEGRWVVVDGRRWRATDPAIPEPWRQELVDELMAARRAVAVATRAGDGDAERAARARVQQAKVALGERGPRWWDPPTDDSERQRLRAILLALVAHRAPDRTICPSDVARARGEEGWRGRMEQVRDLARVLARDGEVVVTQKGETLDPDQPWRGPIRIGDPAVTDMRPSSPTVS